MAIANIFAKGLGFAPGSTKWIPTHGFGLVSVVVARRINLAGRDDTRIVLAGRDDTRIVLAGRNDTRIALAGDAED